MTPATRMLHMAQLIADNPGIGGGVLAEILQVDTRTIRRYVVRLMELGYPITSARGKCGGYRLLEGGGAIRLPSLPVGPLELNSHRIEWRTNPLAIWEEIDTRNGYPEAVGCAQDHLDEHGGQIRVISQRVVHTDGERCADCNVRVGERHQDRCRAAMSQFSNSGSKQ